jgi:hypothetical protein
MWELQLFSTNRRTIEISLLLGENTLLTISQIPHNFVGLLSLLSLYLLSSFSLVVCFFMARMHCLFIGKHPCLCLAKDKARQVAPIGAASGTELVPILLTYLHQLVPANLL